MKTKKEKFVINCNCVLIGTDIKNIKQYILSTKPDTIELPKFCLSQTNLKNIDADIITYMQSMIALSDIELTPQIISLHSNFIESKTKNEINVVYGFVSSYTESIDNDKVYWIEFSYHEYNPYSYLIAEVTRKLK